MILKFLKGYMLYFLVMVSICAGLTLYGSHKLLNILNENPPSDNIWLAIYKSGIKIENQEVLDQMNQQIVFAKKSLAKNKITIQETVEEAERLKKHKMDYSDLMRGGFCSSPLFESIGLAYAINDKDELKYAVDMYTRYFKGCREDLRDHHVMTKAGLKLIGNRN